MIPGNYLRKLKPIASGGLFLNLPTVSNMVLSLLVVRLFSIESWGRIVELQLITYLFSSLLAYGNKEYLLREYTLSKKEISGLFQTSFFTRSLLLLFPLAILPFLNLEMPELIHVFSWIFFRFISQSFESLVIFYKKFILAIASEVISMACMICLLLVLGGSSYQYILLIISFSLFIKTLLLVLIFRKDAFRNLSVSLHIPIFKKTMTFAFLSFIGFLQSKGDLLCVVFYLSRNEIASYQVLMGFILFLQGVPAILATPFIKVIYRIRKSKIKALNRISIISGFGICIVGIPFTFIILKCVYHIDLPVWTYCFAFISVFSVFFYFLYIYAAYRSQNQREVMFISSGGVAFNIVACLILIPSFGITGALAANCITQLICWPLYKRVAGITRKPF